MEANSTWFTVVSVFVAFVALFGLGVMFVRGTNIERNGMVGGLTFASAAVAGLVLYLSRDRGFTELGLLSLALLSVMGFVLGRAIDRYLGAEGPSSDARKATLGADLSD